MSLEVLVTLAGWLPLLGKWITRPKLDLMLPDREIFDVADEETEREPGLFVHLIISNQGRTTAHEVVGYVTNVEKVPDRKEKLAEGYFADVTLSSYFEKVGGFRNQVQLKWSHEPLGEGYKPKTVMPDRLGGRPRRLDLCYIFLDEEEFHLFTEHGPRGQRLQFDPGIYRLTVLVTWERGRRRDKKFIIYWDGDWTKFGITEDSYREKIEKTIADRKRVVSKCEKLISKAFDRYKESHLVTDTTSVEDRKILVHKVPETLGTSVDDRVKKK